MRVHCCFVCRVGSIKGIDVSKLRMTENLGVFWPRSVYEKHKKGKIPPKMVSRVQHHGKWVVGTLLEPSHGNPVGTFQTDSITEVGAAKEGEILSTGDAVDDDDYQQTWTAAQARLRTKTSSNNEGQVCVRFATGAAADADSDDEDALMDEIWGGGVVMSSKRSSGMLKDDDDDDEPAQTKKQKIQALKNDPETQAAQAAKAAAKAKAKIDKAAAGVLPKRGGKAFGKGVASGTGFLSTSLSDSAFLGSAKDRQELDRSDAVLFLLGQALNLLKESNTICTLTIKGTQAIVDKINARLTPELTLLYGQGWDGQEGEHRGMKILESLNLGLKRSVAVHGLVEALHNDAAEPMLLTTWLATAVTLDLAPAPSCHEIMFARALTAVAKDLDWSTALSMLDPDATADDSMTINCLRAATPNDEDFTAMVKKTQFNEVLKFATKLLRTSDSAEHPEARRRAACSMQHAKPT
jgi:hypothetical protein